MVSNLSRLLPKGYLVILTCQLILIAFASTSSASKIGQQPQAQSATALPATNNSSKTIQEKQPEAAGSTTSTSGKDCEYERGAWEECGQNRMQQRILKLKPNSNKTRCEPMKIVKRECRVGCKYARGQWSSTCQNGLRMRVDTLVGGGSGSGSVANGTRTLQCQAKRKIFKDCKRACHYVKSAWSDCVNGFRTRNLTLQLLPDGRLDNNGNGNNNDESTDSALLLDNQQRPAARRKLFGLGCVKEKQLKRECRAKDFNLKSTLPNQSNLIKSVTPKPVKLTSSQKRKLKLKSLKQQQPNNNKEIKIANPQ